MIEAAIVGLGRWGRNLVGAVQGKSERLRFVSGVARHPEAAREFAAQHGIALTHDFSEVLGDARVQAVVLATPHSLHAAQIVAAAQAGKAVFCEKPLALTRVDAERAVAVCERAGVTLGVGHDKRFWPSMRELQRVVASGALGTLLHLEAHFSNETPHKFPSAWREAPGEAPGAGMTATGIHVLDALVGLAGPVRRVHAQLVTRKPQPDALDAVSALLEFASGSSGVLATVRVTPSYWRVHAFGNRASAEALGETELVLRASGAPPQRTAFAPADALRFELEAFTDAVAGGAPYPIPAAQMIDTVAAFEAIVASLASGAAVTLDAR